MDDQVEELVHQQNVPLRKEMTSKTLPIIWLALNNLKNTDSTELAEIVNNFIINPISNKKPIKK